MNLFKLFTQVPPNPDTMTVKIEPGNREGDKGETTYTKMIIDLQDVKKECWEKNEKIGHTAGKPNFF